MSRGLSVAETYRDAAERHGIHTLDGDSRKGNVAHDDLMSALSDLRKLDDQGEAILTQLADDPDDSVATWASTHLLPLRERLAIAKLKRVASSTGIIAFGAKMVLQEWKAGRLKIS